MYAIALMGGYATSAASVGTAGMRVLPYVMLISLLAAGYGLYVSIRRAKSSWHTFELLVTDTSVTRTIADFPPITLSRTEIRSIREDRVGTITIQGPSMDSTIYVPAMIRSREVLRGLLGSCIFCSESLSDEPGVSTSAAAIHCLLSPHS